MSFYGGIHPKDNKKSKYYRIENIAAPQFLYLYLQQHTGKISVPLVNVGDYVLRGQKIAEADGLISSTLHSPVSGKVKEIKEIMHPTLCKKSPAIIIENDGKNTSVEFIPKYKDYHRFPKDEIITYIKESGIVGLGGAMFPTHVKLNPPKDKIIDYVIANGCECEPYLTVDDRVMQEYYDEVIEGLKIVMYIVDAMKGIVVIEDNKKEAIYKIKQKIEKVPNVELKVVKTKYPQGAEKQLIKSVLNKEVPSGGLPMDVGVLVHNVSTLFAIYNCVIKGIPLMERVITLSGDISRIGNFIVPIGTSIKDIVRFLNIDIKGINKVIMGGPMMGVAQESLDVSVIKGTSGILFLKTNYDSNYFQCVRCGKCVSVCPMRLMPNFLSIYIEHKKWEKVKKYSLYDCIECGCCSYICIAKRPIVAQIKYAKEFLRSQN
ncbi:MAG: electron transport complex subunit RsxC [Elusimicrobiota bacterium]|nr:electron transport complex subunit RsxC [Endomicrobiia bacterium]MDW8164961.1 electron transport complex subunit RsxC [Elusimicrobiota bacterium]